MKSYTLVELLVVIGIVLLFLAMGIVNFKLFSSDKIIQGDVDATASKIKQVRALAQNPLSADDLRYILALENKQFVIKEIISVDEGPEEVKPVSSIPALKLESDDVEITSPSVIDKMIFLVPSGDMNTNTDVQIVFRKKNSEKTITINKFGVLSVQQ
ncbi:hypothetical protein COT77_00830 [Candidatus Berkelbacteria bacterium CG10_big_fil_rev_8_21_14_0_10_41_12]|uniref:Uncharacterized protein n=1 Tax=Candidatus Berkelbacteria bacterium CG10_big_fil_rev_8_21_14_0_10_41_12 TaxID=1974513 RepID=A0A2M6WXS5_9BACT|nr:MAG: hypothetical protein COT77_00830 [Candidatus Berkelbacteria bacterium CG10_big_fil_rev_8_21_14_0_10_41_12]